MGLFKKKPSDPITARADELDAQLSALESEIKRLSRAPASTPIKVRSTALPKGRQNPARPPENQSEHLFEMVEHPPAALESAEKETHYNELGVRKYDLVAALQRVQRYLNGKPANNPKLVSYLAAGSIKGLRPLRYEKRIARNRFIFLSLFFVLILWGILAVIFNNR